MVCARASAGAPQLNVLDGIVSGFGLAVGLLLCCSWFYVLGRIGGIWVPGVGNLCTGCVALNCLISVMIVDVLFVCSMVMFLSVAV